MREPSRALQLRSELVESLLDRGVVTRGPVEAALRAVPRHAFLPGVSLRRAYADNAVGTRRDAEGTLISSASQPTMVAIMLNQLSVRPGDRVLEIGAGTGYNAALLDELVGADGRVTTLEIDPDVVRAARGALGRAGRDRVRVICADGALGHPGDAPYDRLIVTAGTDDLAPAWSRQLTAAARLVVPLDLCGSTRNIAFVRHGPGWRSESTGVCGFIALRGTGSRTRRRVVLSDDPPISLEIGDGEIDPATVELTDAATVWTQLRLGGDDSLDDLHLYLALTGTGYGRVEASPAALESGRLVGSLDARAVIGPGAFGQLIGRTDPAVGRQLGVVAYGSDAAGLAAGMAARIVDWDAHHRANMHLLSVEALPTGTPARLLPQGHRVDTLHHHLVVSWPGWDVRAQAARC